MGNQDKVHNTPELNLEIAQAKNMLWQQFNENRKRLIQVLAMTLLIAVMSFITPILFSIAKGLIIISIVAILAAAVYLVNAVLKVNQYSEERTVLVEKIITGARD